LAYLSTYVLTRWLRCDNVYFCSDVTTYKQHHIPTWNCFNYYFLLFLWRKI